MELTMPLRLLLDTNIVLGLLKNTVDMTQLDERRGPEPEECAYSAITRIELLGFSGIGWEEDRIIRDMLDNFQYLGVTRQIEDAAISIRRSRTSVKLPDALILATARVHHVRLVTLDQDLEKLGMWLDATAR